MYHYKLIMNQFDTFQTIAIIVVIDDCIVFSLTRDIFLKFASNNLPWS